MNRLVVVSRRLMLVAVIALVASCARSTGRPATAPAPPASTSPATDTASVNSGPVRSIQYAIVATDGPYLWSQVIASTTLSALPSPTAATSCGWPAGCYPAAKPPPSSLLIAFDPAAEACQRATQYAVTLQQGALRIAVSGDDSCGSHDDMAMASASTLLAVPLSSLPASGGLTVTVVPFGKRFGAPAEEITTINLG